MELKGTTKEEIIREMERRSQDTCKVHNPTLETFGVKYNNYLWNFPPRTEDKGFGLGCLLVPRHIAEHYIKHMCDKLISRESDKVVSSAKKKYNGNDWAREEERIALRTNNPALIEKYVRILWKGKVSDYGMDRPIVEEVEQQNSDMPVHLSVLEKIEEEQLRVVTEKKVTPQDDYLKQLKEDDTQGQSI